MRNLATIAIVGTLLLQTGCAAGVAVTRPRLPTIIVGEAPPPPPPPPRRAPLPPPPPPARRAPLPPPPPQPDHLSRGQAIAMGQRWCHANGFACRLEKAKLIRGHSVWRVEFDADRRRGHPGRGKGHYKGRGRGHKKHRHSVDEVRLEFDAWSGALLRVKLDD